MSQARHRLRRLRLHRPPDLRVPARAARPVHRRSGATSSAPPTSSSTSPASTRSTTRSRRHARRRLAHRGLRGRVGRLQHASARSSPTATRSPRRAWPSARTTSTPPASRTGCSRPQERWGAALRRGGPAALARRRADVHDRRDRGQHRARDARDGDARHPRALEGLPDLRLDADDLHDPQGGLVPPGQQRVRRVGPHRHARVRRARPARDRADRAVGRHVPPGVVQERPARLDRHGHRRRDGPRGDGRRRRHDADVRGADPAAASPPSRRPSCPRSPRASRPGCRRARTRA